MKKIEEQIRAIIFDDEFAILGKVPWKQDEPVGKQVEQFKVDSLIALIEKEVIGEDESNEGKTNYTQKIRNHFRRKQRTKLRV